MYHLSGTQSERLLKRIEGMYTATVLSSRNAIMRSPSKYIIVIIFVLFFLFLRLYRLEDSLNFGSDQGATLLETYNLYKQKKIVLINQSGASWTLKGRSLFFGSLPYYVYMPALILFKWNPLAVSYLLVILQLAAGLILYAVLSKQHKKRLALIFMTLWTFTPLLVDYSRFVWASNLMIPMAGLLLALILLWQKSGKKSTAFFIGFVSGMGFEIHFSFLTVIIVSIIWIFITKKPDRKQIFLIIPGFLLGISPLIIFELRHNFYSLDTALFILKESAKAGSTSPFSFNGHYLHSLIPFSLYLISVLWEKAEKMNKFIFSFITVVYIFYASLKILTIPGHGFTMTSGWNYKAVEKAKNTIARENPKEYNLVDILTGDTRAMALRYLLTVAGYPPLDVVSYPSSRSLFIYSKVPVDQILKGSMWEMDVVKPLKVVKKWNLNDDIYLYLLVRTPEL